MPRARPCEAHCDTAARTRWLVSELSSRQLLLGTLVSAHRVSVKSALNRPAKRSSTDERRQDPAAVHLPRPRLGRRRHGALPLVASCITRFLGARDDAKALTVTTWDTAFGDVAPTLSLDST